MMPYMRQIVFILATILFLLVNPSVNQAGSNKEGKYSLAGLDNESEVNAFFLNFQSAIVKHDKAKVAAMIDYPIDVTLSTGNNLKIPNSVKLLKYYDHIFDKRFTNIISKKKTEELWANSQGVSTETGEIWLGGVYKGKSNEYVIKVIAINGVTARH